MPFYRLGAFGRVAALAAVALVVSAGGSAPGAVALAGLFLLWTAYAFIAGVVAVPYNDIVARHVASERRSRLLALLASPLNVVAAGDALAVREIAWLLAAQTLGALVANPWWGAIGDRRGKLALLWIVTLLNLLPPALMLA
jgi:hypothetical protein